MPRFRRGVAPVDFRGGPRDPARGMAPAWVRPEAIFAAKLAIASLAAVLLLADVVLRRRGHADRWRHARDGLLAALGVAGWLAWWNFFAFPVHRFVHEHDGFHHFVGARYFDELGYDGLYACTLAADLEAGLGAWLADSTLRDLETNLLVPAAQALPAAERCRARFSPERWSSFGADVAWFRSIVSQEDWLSIRRDHGFNGSPVWLLAGSLLAEASGGAGPAYFWLARIDTALLVAAWAGVLAAFGWRATAVAAVFWGTNGLAIFDWTGGSLLRQDWLAALLLGLAALRVGRPALAGALLTLATLLRVFPGVAVAALALKAGLAALRGRGLRLSRAHARFALGCLLAAAVLLPLSIWRSGPEAWSRFAANSRKHLATPLLNHVGLRPLAAFEPAERARALEDPRAPDPLLRWKSSQRERAGERAWLIAAVCALYVAALLRALPRLADWEAVALGIGAIPFVTALTCYYHAALVGLALLWPRRAAAGATLCALAGVTQWLWLRLPYADVPFVAMSAAEIAALLFVTWRAGREPRPAGAQAPDWSAAA
jgi:hypothetical protein